MEDFNLGTYSRPINTSNPSAQAWFNRGLLWSYGFNHEAAVQCFRYAIRNNSNCLMAYWGLAYALGPNYNKPWEIFDKEELERNLREARAAIGSAKQQSAAVERPGVEAALVDAVGWRYQESDGSGQVDRSRWNVDYAKAMEDVYHRFSDDLDVAALYADALMNLTPWSLWDQ